LFVSSLRNSAGGCNTRSNSRADQNTEAISHTNICTNSRSIIQPDQFSFKGAISRTNICTIIQPDQFSVSGK